MSSPLDDQLRLDQAKIIEHIEELAAAYLKKTSLPPDRCVLIIQHEYVNWKVVTKMWFEEKPETEPKVEG